MEKLLSILLAVTTALNGWLAGLFPDRFEAAPAMAAGYASVAKRLPARSDLWAAEKSSTAHSGVDYADMEYVHYDDTLFLGYVQTLCDLADAGDLDGLYALADRMYEEFITMDTMTALCYLRHSADIRSEYWAGEYAYMNNLWSQLSDAIYTAFDYVLQSPCGKEFSAYIGPVALDYYTAFEPSTDEDLAMLERELQLQDEYYALYDTMDSITYDYDGRKWTYDLLGGPAGDALGYDDYYNVYYGLQQARAEAFAPTYIELVELRRDMAYSYDYESYIDYAYDELYYRDYGPADAQTLCDAVKPIAREYYAELYYCDAAYDAYDIPAMDGAAMAALLGEYLPRVGDRLVEPWEYMMTHSLYDLQLADAGRLDSGFTIQLAGHNCGYIFDSMGGSCYDFFTMTHEFGHFCNFYYNALPNIILWADDLDLSEIHSNGLQALFTAFYGEIFDADDASLAEFANLSHLLESVIDGCIYDEFQRRVFETDEVLTAETINDIYRQVCDEYGVYGGDTPPWDCQWVYISHNFDSPFYYISYAASALAALQIWDISQRDFDTAARVYLDILDHGAYAQGYFAVLDDCGLTLFRDEGVAYGICRPVLERLAAISRAH